MKFIIGICTAATLAIVLFSASLTPTTASFEAGPFFFGSVEGIDATGLGNSL